MQSESSLYVGVRERFKCLSNFCGISRFLYKDIKALKTLSSEKLDQLDISKELYCERMLFVRCSFTLIHSSLTILTLMKYMGNINRKQWNEFEFSDFGAFYV